MGTVEQGRDRECPVSGFPLRKTILGKVWRDWKEAKTKDEKSSTEFFWQIPGERDEVNQDIAIGS